MKLDLSIVIPVYNEEKILEKSVADFIRYFGKNKRVGKFEIILVENGSTDETYKIAQKLEINNKVKLIRVGEKSLGKALSLGIKKAGFPYVYFDAIDNPFGFQDLEKFLDIISSHDLIFASKNHKYSVYKSKISRKIASKILSILNRLLFALPISDTQGTFMGRREKLVKILPFCTSKGAFFQIQLAIYAIRENLKVAEVPVEFVSSGKKSNFSLLKDGLVLMGDLIRERIKLNKI